MTSTRNPETGALERAAWRWGIPVFAVLAMALVLLLSANIPLFLMLNRGMAHLDDAIWSHLTLLGDTSVAALLLLPLVAWRPHLAWQLLLGAIIAGVSSRGFKELLAMPRPPAVLEAGSFHVIGQALRVVSFPSGHTTTAFALAGLLCLKALRGPVRYVILLLALLVGLSRIACGVHWPMDVLGGALLGWLSAMAGIWLGERWGSAGSNLWMQRALAALGVALAAWVMVWYRNPFPETVWLQVSIAAGCLAAALPGLARLSGIHANRHTS